VGVGAGVGVGVREHVREWFTAAEPRLESWDPRLRERTRRWGLPRLKAALGQTHGAANLSS
jgi:hypothetical protein